MTKQDNPRFPLWQSVRLFFGTRLSRALMALSGGCLAVVGIYPTDPGLDQWIPGERAQESKLELSHYRLSQAPITLGTNLYNASGLTWNEETETLFLILNDPPRIKELNRDGDILRAIRLDGFEDTEDLVHLGGTRFAVVEEQRRTLALINIDDETFSVDYAGVTPHLIEPEETGNNGLEGLTYDPRNEDFYAVREKRPRRIYRFSLAEAPELARLTHPWDAQRYGNGLRDLSAIHFDSASGRLLLLSDESKGLLEVDGRGQVLSRMRLLAGEHGLPHDIPQAEGVTMDKHKTLFICSEPNLLYIFAPGVDRATPAVAVRESETSGGQQGRRLAGVSEGQPVHRPGTSDVEEVAIHGGTIACGTDLRYDHPVEFQALGQVRRADADAADEGRA